VHLKAFMNIRFTETGTEGLMTILHLNAYVGFLDEFLCFMGLQGYMRKVLWSISLIIRNFILKN